MNRVLILLAVALVWVAGIAAMVQTSGEPHLVAGGRLNGQPAQVETVG